MKTERVELRNFFNALNAALLVCLVWVVLYFSNELPEKSPFTSAWTERPTGGRVKGT